MSTQVPLSISNPFAQALQTESMAFVQTTSAQPTRPVQATQVAWLPKVPVGQSQV